MSSMTPQPPPDSNAGPWIRKYLAALLADPALQPAHAGLLPLFLEQQIDPALERGQPTPARLTLQNVLSRSPAMVLLGPSGSGKSTLLRQLVRELAQEASTNPQAPLPLYVPLTFFDGSIEGTLAAQARQRGPALAALALARPCILIVDALNDLPPVDQIPVLGAIRRALGTLEPHGRWIIACRSEAWGLFDAWLPGNRYQVWRVRPWTDQAILTAVQRQGTPAHERLLQLPGAIELARRPRWLGSFLQLRDDVLPGPLLLNWIGATAAEAARTHCLPDQCAELAVTLLDDIGIMLQRHPTISRALIQSVVADAAALSGLAATDLQALLDALALLQPAGDDEWTFRSSLLRDLKQALDLHADFGRRGASAEDLPAACLAQAKRPTPLALLYGMLRSSQPLLKSLINSGAWEATQQVLDANVEPDESLAILEDTGLIDSAIGAALGRAWAAGGSPEVALALLEWTVKQGRDDPYLFGLVGQLHRRAGNWAEARGALQEALRRDPANLDYKQALAQVCQELGESDTATTTLEGVLEAYHNGVATTAYQLGSLQEEKGKLHEALEQYSLAATLCRNEGGQASPEASTYLLAKARVLRRLGRHEEAKEALRAIDDDSADTIALADENAALLEATGNDRAAIKRLEEIESRGSATATTFLRMAELHRRQDDREAADRAYRAAAEANPRCEAAYEGIAELAASAGDIPTAVSAYERLVDLRKDSPEAWRRLGAFQRQDGRFAESVRSLQKSLQLAPSSEAQLELARTRWAQGDQATALSFYRSATADDPDGRHAAEAGWAFLEAGDLGTAQTLLERAAGLRPADGRVLYDLGRCYEVQGATTRALEWFMQAAHVSPSASTFRATGRVARLLGEYGMARQMLARAVHADRRNGDTAAELGRLHLEEDRPDLAAKALRRAQAAGVDDVEVQRDLAEGLLRLGDAPAALALIEPIAVDDNDFQTKRSRAYEMMGDPHAALGIARAAAARQPHSAALQRRVGALALQAGAPAEALAALEAARTFGDKEPSTLVNLSRAMLLTGRVSAALRPVDEALQRIAAGSPDEVPVQVQRGRALLALEEWVDARQAFERALEVAGASANKAPKSAGVDAFDVGAVGPGLLAEAWGGLAEAYAPIAGATSALPYARHALELAPGNGGFVRLVGRLLLDAGDRAAARAVLGSDAAAEPATLRLRLQVEMADGQWAVAVPLAARCHAVSPHDPQVTADYGTALLNAGQPEEALPLLEAVCASPMAAASWWASLGRCHLKLGNMTIAVQALNRSLEGQPDVAQTHADLAAAYMAQDAPGSAVHALRQALELAGERLDWRTTLARAYRAQGWFAEALAEWQRALDHAHATGAADTALRIEVARARLDLGEAETALADLEAMIGADPKHTEAWQLLSRAALAANDPARAVYAASCALGAQPHNVELRVQLAEAALAARDPQRAYDTLSPLVQADEPEIKALLLIHKAANQLENPSGARLALERAGRIAPGDPEVQLAIAEHLYATGEVDRAVKFLRSVLARHGDGAAVMAKVAGLAVRVGDLELARQAAERAVELSPQDPEYARLYGHICFEAGDFTSARRALQQAMRGRQDPETALILGKLALQRGEATEATRLLRMAHEHRTEDVEATGWLALALRRQHEPVLEDEAPEPQSAPGLDAAVLLLRQIEQFPIWRAELGWTLVLRGDYQEAIAMLNSAARADELPVDRRIAALRRVGVVLLAVGRAGDAMTPLERAQELAEANNAPDGTIFSLLGQIAEVHSNVHAAIQYYGRATSVEPDNGRHHLRIGLTLLESGETEAALDHFGRATELEPARAAAWTAYSKGLLHLRETDQAMTAAQRAVQLGPQDGAAWRQLAAVHEARGEIRAALDALEKGVAHAPVGPAGAPDAKEWLIYFANLAIAHGETARGRAALQSASDLDPMDADLLYQLALLHGPAERIALLQRAIDLKPSKAAWRTQLADLLAARGDHRPALDQLAQAIEAEPGNGEHWLALARAHVQTGNDQEAEATLRRARELIEPDAAIAVALGNLLAGQNRWAEALEIYIEAAHLRENEGASNEEIADRHADCGRCLQALGRLDEAGEALMLAMDRDPTHARAATYLAQVHMLRDTDDAWKSAIKWARVATTHAPTELGGYKLQARAALRGKWREEFKTALEHAYALAPEDPELHELQGWYYFGEGKIDMARSEVERAIEHDPQSATSYHLLAEIYRADKRWAEAMAALRTAVRLDGKYTSAIKALTSIGLEALIHSGRKPAG